MPLVLYDTWERALRPFTPLQADHVGLYCCGPTVYDYAHLGNLRTYVFEDVLRRVLQHAGYRVRHVVNITDVGHLVSDADQGEDKMEKGSRRTGESAWTIADKYTAAFQADWRALNLLEPALWCKATEHIGEQIAMIAAIEANGFTYRTADGVYFDSSKQDDYGYLARLDRAGLDAGARVALGDKRHATDFALWKLSPPDSQRQMEWDSPWGRGFPGWHIECSAMAAKYLTPWFDIHCGGEDHVAVHHSNEIAQSEACFGTRLANYWMHGHFMLESGEKMSKSSGQFLRLQTLLDRGNDALAFRYLCLTAHYRSQLRFSLDALDAAQVALDRLRKTFADWPDGGSVDAHWAARFDAEINQDLNLPRGLALVWELARSPLDAATRKATVAYCDQVLGLGLAHWQPTQRVTPPAVAALQAERAAARANKDWPRADALRQQLLNLGWEVQDKA
ncbi:cysteine--tRNA ligase [Amantichitinum ursilacus]|uniref:Cysteine--tRNA ligase n=1 Tax=Amantichitinum ursilacus TaxID=857265 RepID=A0A0N1JRY1_9NEIS|nr:cysteine--tRNA ligase [Amantichitinum ursilacus]KPC51352.1 Cysteine--tRNA ligase [Amantichitinum ursilacus]